MDQLLTKSVGEIVRDYPQAARVLEKYKIDYCCGGNRLLEEALQESPHQHGPIVSDLFAAVEQANQMSHDQNPALLGLDELIEYIMTTHHRYVLRELPIISGLLTTILRVHGSNHSELRQVHRLFHQLKMELDQHLIKEEEILFPAIRTYLVDPTPEQRERAITTLHETEQEHDVAGSVIKQLQDLTNDFTPPEDGCGTYDLAYTKLAEFQQDLFQHIHLENNVLFPRFLERR